MSALDGQRYFDRLSSLHQQICLKVKKKNSAIGQAEVAAYDFTRLETGACSHLNLRFSHNCLQTSGNRHIGDINITRTDFQQFEALMLMISLSQHCNYMTSPSLFSPCELLWALGCMECWTGSELVVSQHPPSPSPTSSLS